MGKGGTVASTLAIALKGKGLAHLLKRSLSIARRYGLTPSRMDRALGGFVQALAPFACGATFPLTAWTLSHRGGWVGKYQARGIELAIHGYYHIDYSQLSLEQQIDHFSKAQQMFDAHHLDHKGFRSPYLRYNNDTLTALDQLDFSYDSSQAIAWDVVNEFMVDAYQRALEFYRAKSAEACVCVPRLAGDKGLVQIPYSLPDDEALVERLKLAGTEVIDTVWVEMLRRTHELGELFVLGLHPERIRPCENGLRTLLNHAFTLTPGVWIARLDEIAEWWRRRAATTYQVSPQAEGRFQIAIEGPPGMTVLARDVVVEAPTDPWDKGYQRVTPHSFMFRAPRLPLIGISPDAPESLVSFLRQQGYLLARSTEARLYTFYFDQKEFTSDNERSILMKLEEGDWPLLRLARWPGGAQSALSITGDIDALTLWDYGLRLFVR